MLNVSLDLGAFTVIKNAYDESTDAAKKVDASEKTVKESADVREEVKDLHNRVQPGNTRDLDKLNYNIASRPDLTPVAKQVHVPTTHLSYSREPDCSGVMISKPLNVFQQILE